MCAQNVHGKISSVKVTLNRLHYLYYMAFKMMKQSQIWGLQRAGIICLNTYLIFSLNFVAIFAHGSPDRISDNIHSSNRQRYRDRHHNYSNKGGSDQAGSSAQGNNVNIWKSQSPSGYNHRTGTPSSYSFNSQNVGRSDP